MLSGMKAMTVPDLPCQKSNLFLYTKNIITYLFTLQMRKYFMQRIEQKWIENWTSLFCGKLDFWRGRSDTAARCGHGFHNHHITCQLWPLQVTYDRMTDGNTPYDQSLQPFLVEAGRIWKHRSISSIIISWLRRRYPVKIDGRLWNLKLNCIKNLKNEIKVKEG